MSTYAEVETVKAYLAAKALAAAERMKNAQIGQDFLDGDRYAIREYLKEDLEKTFSEDDVKAMHLVWINLIPKIVKRLSMLYKTPPKRSIGDKSNESLDQALRVTGYDRALLEAHRGAKFHNTVLMGALPDGRGSVRHVILRPNLTYVEPDPDDYTRIKWLKYPMMREVNGKEIIVWSFWSDEEHFWRNENGAEIPVPNQKDNRNPYGINPFGPVRILTQNDFWGDGMMDLVDANRAINFLITSALVENIVMSAYGTPFGVNLDLGDEIKFGPRHAVTIDGVTDDMKDPKLEFVTSETFTSEISEVIEWLHKVQGTVKGLPASAFSQVEQTLSGYAKLIDNMELLEDREEEVPLFQDFERNYLTRFAKVWNVAAKGQKSIPEDYSDLSISFGKIRFPENMLDITRRRRMEAETGTKNEIDWIMEDHPGMTREKAIEYWKLREKERLDLKLAVRGNAPDSDNMPEE